MLVTIEQLSVDEKIKLSQLEETIDRGQKAFYEAGKALLTIRDERLYREQHPSFEDYCQHQWGMSRRHADRLIEAATVVENLRPIGLTPPAVESQCRELAKLPSPEQQIEAWVETVKASPSPTAAQVRSSVEQVQKRVAIAPGSRVRATVGDYAGQELEVAKVDNGGAVVYAATPDGSYPFLAGEVEVIEAAAPQAPKPKADYRSQAEALKLLLSRCLPYLPADLMAEVEAAIEA